jgi:hypothetical protein
MTNQNKTEEVGLSKLSLGSVSLSEQMADQAKQREIERTMAGIVDYRGNVHEQSMSMLPRRPTPPAPTPASRNGWVEPPPLSTPHVAACDRLVDAFEAEEKAKQK